MNEFTQRDLVAYILYSYKDIENYSEKTLNNYIKKLKNDLKNTPIGQVFWEINLSLFNDFKFKAKLDDYEKIAYAKLIYQELLNRIDKSFVDEDIKKKSEDIYYSYSGRTAIEKVEELRL